MAERGTYPSPNPAYPWVGPNYIKYGERAGLTYLPLYDKYTSNQNAIQQHQSELTDYLQAQEREKNLANKQYETAMAGEPGLFEQAAPMAVGAGIPLVIEKGVDYVWDKFIPSATESKGLLSAAGDLSSTSTLPGVSTQGSGLLSAATGTPASLPVSMQASNLLQGMPANAVASTVGPSGEAATILAAENPSMSGPLGPATGTGPLGSMPMLQGTLGGAGLIAGAMGMKEAYERGSPLQGAISGVGAGVGASMLGSSLGLAFLPGIGWMAAGGAILGTALGLFGGPPKTEVEDKRFKKLSDKGILMHTSSFVPESRTRKEQLKAVKDLGVEPGFVGVHPEIGWVNTKWLESGKESDLKAEDIWGYSAFYEKYGNKWLGEFSEDDRRRIAQEAIDKGAVREHHGTIDVDWKKAEAETEEEKKEKEEEKIGQTSESTL